MPARLYLRPQPRAFFLLTDTHALVFRQPGAEETKASRSVVVAEFLPLDEVDTTGLVSAGAARSVEGVLGVTSIPSERSPVPDVFLLLLTASTPLPSLIPGSGLRPARVLSVEFHSLSSNFWDPPSLVAAGSSFDPVDADDGGDFYQRVERGTNLSAAQQAGVEDPCSGMRKYLESGGFFHAAGCQWDISRHLGSPGTNLVDDEAGQGRSPLEGWDERFVWNAHLLQPLLMFRRNLPQHVRDELDAHALILPVIQGYVGSVPLGPGSWTPAEGKLSGLAMISRLSCKRAGARFRTRGIDDDGNVANFVETEVILCTGGTIVSYTQVRGSVPLFWQQPQQGFSTLQQKVEITRPPQATQPAFDKHFLDLLEHYGAVHAINLLGQKDAEAMLSNAYSDRFRALKNSLNDTGDDEASRLTYTPYDFHSVVRTGGHDAVRTDLNAMGDIANSLDAFGYTAVDLDNGETIATQHGTFRTNCLDCLDRTNFVQEVLSSIALRRFLGSNGSALLNSPTLWSAHRELWADNGDRLSKTYAGTGALNTSATRSGRKTFAGLISDATKSVGRAYINNFLDKDKQAAIDLLLGLMAGQRPVVLFDPVSDSVQSALLARREEYSTPRNLRFFSGTWNVNGKLPDSTLDAWLFPGGVTADVYSIAFQEIVELTPQQIVQPDPAKKKVWENQIMETFSRHAESAKANYIMLRSEQLVGTALMIVVKENLLPAIRGIEYASKKTGLQGLSGNKGGIGFRFTLYDASVCLMTCHLAAGQSAYADRNADYRTISNGLTFLRGKMIDSHDIVIWAADFNYRIDLPNEEVRAAATSMELDTLVAADQLSLARDDGEVFAGYSEGALTFPPTYKYDNGTDTYDSSEKQRIPAWTDRVLYKGEGLHLRAYNQAELRTSDHRPVYALFEAVVLEVDEARRAAIATELAGKARAAAAGGHLDAKVERAAAGGVRGLVKEFTSVSLAPSPARSGSTTPELPSRPRAAPSLLNTVNSAYARLGQPPPLPPRVSSPASVSANSTGSAAVPYEARRRPAPPPPSGSSSGEFRKLGLPEEITPVATGDFVLVPSPQRPAVPLPTRRPSLPVSTAPAPALPPRPRPTKSATLDLDAPPPDNLIAAVLPDNRRPAPPPPKPRPGAEAKVERKLAEEAKADEADKGGKDEKPRRPAPAVPHSRDMDLVTVDKPEDVPPVHLASKPEVDAKPALPPKPRQPSLDLPPPIAPKPARTTGTTWGPSSPSEPEPKPKPKSVPPLAPKPASAAKSSVASPTKEETSPTKEASGTKEADLAKLPPPILPKGLSLTARGDAARAKFDLPHSAKPAVTTPAASSLDSAKPTTGPEAAKPELAAKPKPVKPTVASKPPADGAAPAPDSQQVAVPKPKPKPKPKPELAPKPSLAARSGAEAKAKADAEAEDNDQNNAEEDKDKDDEPVVVDKADVPKPVSKLSGRWPPGPPDDEEPVVVDKVGDEEVRQLKPSELRGRWPPL